MRGSLCRTGMQILVKLAAPGKRPIVSNPSGRTTLRQEEQATSALVDVLLQVTHVLEVVEIQENAHLGQEQLKLPLDRSDRVLHGRTIGEMSARFRHEGKAETGGWGTHLTR